ncbi:sensor histidine kinase [Pseudoduganella namucuonensis]|uniref:histidine kinase n=1 Tax=Pseudoduganella namucuonensis TaxID=1035707 RepID=A0A1I7GVN2_9BURK|nr:histidine kinase [Pseudoduganella namucuonensis]SFU52498.1 Histidine kinase-, DNA gyrase B-, and HSP90-like ATPase [Pseudoduganella namucuonensis]
MSAAAPAAPLDASRVADLSELLGHTNACWDNERRQLSRQLHDSMGSSLTALTMHLGLLMQKMPPDPALQERATQMKNLLHNIIESNRQMQHKLWNDKLEFLGVRVALGELVAQFGAEQGLAARCSLPEEEPRAPRAHSVVLLRAAEEALRNVSLHARATEVEVVVDDNDDEIMLTVKDNGVGPPRPNGHGGGGVNGLAEGKHGLRVLRERAAYLGGTLTLLPGAAGGATLTVVLPKPAP